MDHQNDQEVCMTAYKVLLWDIDGTILNFRAAEKYAFSESFFRFFSFYPEDDMIRRYSVLNESWWQKLERGEAGRSEILTERFREFFEKEGLPPADPVQFNALYHSLLPETIVFNDDCLPMLKRFGEYTKQYAVTNGTKSVQDSKLKRSGLLDVFDDVFISEVIGAEKPSAEFFRYVSGHIPSVSKEEILLIGDSLTSDITGGLRFGVPVCWYNPEGRDCPENMPIDYVIRDLRELEGIV